MHLYLDGLGTAASVGRVDFVLDHNATTRWRGYASNADDRSLPGGGSALTAANRNDLDYSFAAHTNQLAVRVTADTDPAVGRILGDGAYAKFWAKDYAGVTAVNIGISVESDGFVYPARRVTLRVPLDTDGDLIADLWERDAVQAWNTQYAGAHPIPPADELSFFDRATDEFAGGERRDPDGPGILQNQNSIGDSLTVLYEYRGVVVDGGGENAGGAGGHPGGHLRLNPARKEILVEVDQNAMPAPAVPATRETIVGWMNGVANAYAAPGDYTEGAASGAGIWVYYIVDNLATPRATFAGAFGPWINFQNALGVYVANQRHPDLAEKFMHIQLVEGYAGTAIRPGETVARAVAGAGWSTFHGLEHVNLWGVTAMSNRAGHGPDPEDPADTTPRQRWWTEIFPPQPGVPPALTPFNTLMRNIIVHELSHPYASGLTAATGGHLRDTNGDGAGNQLADFPLVLFAYDQQPPPPGYTFQDANNRNVIFGPTVPDSDLGLLSIYDLRNANSIREGQASWE
jgi:hypothetical protein